MNVAQILRSKGDQVVTIGATATIADALALLAKESIGAIVVADGGKTVKGILSERDIVRGLARQGAAVIDRPVTDLMTAEVISCAPDDDTADIMTLMTEKRIRHVPVLRAGKLCGIVTIGDMVKSRLGEVEAEREAMLSYITSG